MQRGGNMRKWILGILKITREFSGIIIFWRGTNENMGSETAGAAAGMAAACNGVPEQRVKRAGVVRRAANQHEDILPLGTGNIGSGGKTACVP